MQIGKRTERVQAVNAGMVVYCTSSTVADDTDVTVALGLLSSVHVRLWRHDRAFDSFGGGLLDHETNKRAATCRSR